MRQISNNTSGSPSKSSPSASGSDTTTHAAEQISQSSFTPVSTIQRLRFSRLRRHWKTILATTVGGAAIGCSIGAGIAMATGAGLIIFPLVAVAGLLLGGACGFVSGIVGSFFLERAQSQPENDLREERVPTQDTNHSGPNSLDILAHLSNNTQNFHLPAPQALLFQACRDLDSEKVRLAISQGADVNQLAPCTGRDRSIFYFGHKYHTPLSLVAMRTYASRSSITCEITTILLENGADIDIFDQGDMGNSPLHWAIVARDKALCHLLINHAKNHQKEVINLPNKPLQKHFGTNPPLILALKAFAQSLEEGEHDLEIAISLIAAGANVSLTDHLQQSALHWAAILRVPIEFFDLLLSKNAKSLPNFFGETPQMLYQMKLSAQKVDLCAVINGTLNSCTELGFFIGSGDNGFSQAILDAALQTREKNFQPEVMEKLNAWASKEEKLQMLPDKAHQTFLRY